MGATRAMMFHRGKITNAGLGGCRPGCRRSQGYPIQRFNLFNNSPPTEYPPVELGDLVTLLFNHPMKILFTILTLVGLVGQALAQVQSPAEQNPKTEGRNPNGEARPTLWLIGDSTVRNNTRGQQGWGDPIKDLFDPGKIRVENQAL